MKNFICHCTVSAFDGNGTVGAKPTVYVEATDRIRAYINYMDMIRSQKAIKNYCGN